MASTVAAALLGVAGAALLFTQAQVTSAVQRVRAGGEDDVRVHRESHAVSAAPAPRIGGSAPPQVRLVVRQTGVTLPGSELIALSI